MKTEEIEEIKKILKERYNIKLIGIYPLDNPSFFVYVFESERLGWQLYRREVKSGICEYAKYNTVEDFVADVVELERQRYFEYHIARSIYQANEKLESDIYNQWKQLDEKGLDLPEEITVNLTLKFPKP